MNETQEPTTVEQTEVMPFERAATIRHLCRKINFLDEFVTSPTLETKDYIGRYVDLRAIDPEAAAEQFRAIEQRLEQERKFREQRAFSGLGKQGIRSGFGK